MKVEVTLPLTIELPEDSLIEETAYDYQKLIKDIKVRIVGFDADEGVQVSVAYVGSIRHPENWEAVRKAKERCSMYFPPRTIQRHRLYNADI